MKSKPADHIRPKIWKSIVPHISNHKLKLPELPVPPLEQTAQRLLESAKVLTTDENQIKTLELRIASFLANEGPKLQNRLEEYKKDPRNLFSLEQIWDDANYMEYRDSIVVNVSFFYGFVPMSRPLSETQYAARIAHYALHFRKTLFDGQLEPDFIGKDKSPLCMNSYRFMFDACRIPCKPADYVSVNRRKIGHVAVIHKGNWWSIPATTADGTPLSISELEQKMDYIINQPVKEGFVGVLTTRNRDKWADDRMKLIQIDPTNADSLAEIESAAFVIALDGTQALDTPVTKSRHLWHAGDGGKFSNNRFVDKPAQFICWTDQSSNTARGGLMGEHSTIDGTPIVRFCEFILENIEKFLHRLEEPVDQSIANARTDISMPLHLPFNESGLEASINEARDEVAKLSDNQALGYTVINGGKSIIKENGLSPDAWAQMIIQLAYSRLVAIEGSENVPAATYEAATMRSFINGRYECIRSATSDSATFVDAMNNTKKTNADRKVALKTAVNTHVRNTKQVSSGYSVDRHLFDLQKSLYPSEQVPELFIDELFNKSSTWAMWVLQCYILLNQKAYFSSDQLHKYLQKASRHTVGERSFRMGFGVAYSIFENCLQFTVTNTITYGTKEDKNGKGKKRNDTIVALLDEAAKDMLILLKPAQRQAKL